MPLRVTKEYSTDMPLRVKKGSTDEGDGQKVHKKMSKNGHYQKVRRPTGLEVYNDAANILEELLEKRIDRDVKVAGRQRRNRTDPIRDRVSSTYSGADVVVARCKTMPSRYREGFDEDCKKKEVDDSLKKEHKKNVKKGGIDMESDSSANVTEGESDGEDANSVTKNRKKKSVFKRAKENLMRSFQRDQKEGFGKIKEGESHSKKKKKSKKKSDSVVSESRKSLKGHLNKDKSIDYTEMIDYRHHTKDSSNTDSHKIRSGSMSRSSLMDAIRKPFSSRKSLPQGDNLDDDEKNRRHAENGVKIISIDDDDSSVYPAPSSSRHFDSSTPSPTPRSITDTQDKKESLILPSTRDQIPVASQDLLRGGGNISSTGSTHYPESDYNNSVGSLNFLPSLRSNILDSPGDDIGYIDDFDEDRDKRKSLIKYHGSEGLLNLQWLADQTANAKAFDFEIERHSISTRRPDGHLEMTTTVTATRTVVLPEVLEEGSDHHDGDVKEKPEPIKDELYGKIAQKLIEMADTYGAMSDAEENGGEATALADVPLTDLEKEIIACLRSGGDKYDKQMEDQLDALKAAVAEDGYDRFRSTVQNTMGHELSWNTLALLFYATKGVVSAVGKSSKAAGQAKEFTLKYISDTFVSWIMEQGGFDSMLSDSEPDSELD